MTDVFAIPDTLAKYLARASRYPVDVTDGERAIIDAIDTALRSLHTSRLGPYGALAEIATTVLNLIEDREPDKD